MAFVPYYPGEAGYSGASITTMTGLGLPTSNSMKEGYVVSAALEGSLEVTKSPLYNSQGAVINGWQTLQTGEDPDPGGSNRPTSGMIYPRGTG